MLLLKQKKWSAPATLADVPPAAALPNDSSGGTPSSKKVGMMQAQQRAAWRQSKQSQKAREIAEEGIERYNALVARGKISPYVPPSTQPSTARSEQARSEIPDLSSMTATDLARFILRTEQSEEEEE